MSVYSVENRVDYYQTNNTNHFMLISALITLVVTLAVIYIVYLVVNWGIGVIRTKIPGFPTIIEAIINVILGVFGVVAVLKFVGSAFGGYLGF